MKLKIYSRVVIRKIAESFSQTINYGFNTAPIWLFQERSFFYG